MVSCAYILYAATTLSLLALRLTNNAEGWSERKENWKFDYVTPAGQRQGTLVVSPFLALFHFRWIPPSSPKLSTAT